MTETTTPTSSDAGSPAVPDAQDDIDAQDDVVQALVVASYALQMGDNSRARVAVDGALRRCRDTLDALLRERAGRSTGRGLVRSGPATVSTRDRREVTGVGRRPPNPASSSPHAGGHHTAPTRRNLDGRRERRTSTTRPGCQG